MRTRPSSTTLRAAAFLLLAALWAAAAFFLWRSRVPGNLSLPRLDERALFGPRLLHRAEGYERLVDWVSLGGILAQIAALAVMTVRGPRLARGVGLGPIGTGVIVGLVTMLAAWAAGIPFTAVLTWWDRRHGLSDEGYVTAVLGPYAELFGLTMTALLIVVVVMTLARKLGRCWWLVGAPAFVTIAAGFAFIVPYLLGIGTHRLSDPGLSARIARLEQATGAGPTPVYVEKASDYTTLPNAYTVGFGPSERIVLWDTILDGRFSQREIGVVVAHELGHVARGHIWKGLAWLALAAFPGLFLISETAHRRGGLGLAENIPLAALAFAVLSLCFAPVTNGISRHFEREADWIALEATRDPAAMQSLFTKFARVSLADPTPPLWAQALFGTHPADLERIAMAQAWRRRSR